MSLLAVNNLTVALPPGADRAHAIEAALKLEPDDYRAHAARSRQFAEYTFSPHRAAAATLEIYLSLLEAQE